MEDEYSANYIQTALSHCMQTTHEALRLHVEFVRASPGCRLSTEDMAAASRTKYSPSVPITPGMERIKTLFIRSAMNKPAKSTMSLCDYLDALQRREQVYDRLMTFHNHW